MQEYETTKQSLRFWSFQVPFFGAEGIAHWMLDWLNTDVATPIWVSAAYEMDSIEGKVSHLEPI